MASHSFFDQAADLFMSIFRSKDFVAFLKRAPLEATEVRLLNFRSKFVARLNF
jgi:hypothetical protein